MIKIAAVFNAEAKENKLCKDLTIRINRYRNLYRDCWNTYVHACRLTSIEDTKSILQEYKIWGMGLMCISGGDGTNGRTIDKLIQVYGAEEPPIIAPLPGGKMNNFAKSVGIEDGQFKVLDTIIDKLLDKDKKDIPVIEKQILDIYADGRKMHGFVLSDGCASNFLDLYNEIPPMKRSGYEALKLVFGCFIYKGLRDKVFEKAKGKVYFDGKEIYSGQYSGLSVSAIDGFSTAGLNFFHVKNGYLNALGANASWINVALQLPRFFLKTAKSSSSL